MPGMPVLRGETLPVDCDCRSGEPTEVKSQSICFQRARPSARIEKLGSWRSPTRSCGASWMVMCTQADRIDNSTVPRGVYHILAL